MYCRLELVNDTHCGLIVGRNASGFGVIVVIQLVEFIRSVDVHVFVEVVPGTHFDVFNQVSIAAGEASARAQVFTFSLYVADGRTQAEVELILNNGFEVLSFVSEVVAFVFRRHVVSLRVHDRSIDVVRVILSGGCPCFSFFALTVSFLIAATVGVRIACRQRNAVVKRVGCRGAEAVAVLFLNITARSVVFTLV